MRRKSSMCFLASVGFKVTAGFKRAGTYVHLWPIHVDVRQIPTQYCKAIILPIKINLKKKKKSCSCRVDTLLYNRGKTICFFSKITYYKMQRGTATSQGHGPSASNDAVGSHQDVPRKWRRSAEGRFSWRHLGLQVRLKNCWRVWS